MSGVGVAVPAIPPHGFIPALEGLRAFAALGVLVTHVAFQTGSTSWPVLGRGLGRLDMAVAVFFALSGALLWRPRAEAARGLGAEPRLRTYLRSRVVRILPVYWAVVIAVLVLLPEAGTGWKLWLANLTLTQVFVPYGLTGGLTQMWSLSVEMTFYLLLPILAVALARLRTSWRVPVLLVAAAASLSWAFLPIGTPVGVHTDTWMPGYLSWFVAGMLIGEAAAVAAVVPGDAAGVSRAERWVLAAGRRRWLMAGLATVAFVASSTDLAGPEGLVRTEPWQFCVKTALGALIGFGLVAPLVLRTDRHRILDHPVVLALGRWSYGIFLWHLLVLGAVFPIFGVLPFTGQFFTVLIPTMVISVVVAAASYALIEEPARRRFGRARPKRPKKPPKMPPKKPSGGTAIADTPAATTAMTARS